MRKLYTVITGLLFALLLTTCKQFTADIKVIKYNTIKISFI